PTLRHPAHLPVPGARVRRRRARRPQPRHFPGARRGAEAARSAPATVAAADSGGESDCDAEDAAGAGGAREDPAAGIQDCESVQGD
ncbi:hypothetical protein V493_02585, partial [Pseudogymnoascus sp. VKM F-4281 (FW-2241)]